MSVKISVVIPIYNGEQVLSRCVDSLLCQTLDSIEIICVNDGSSDRTRDIIDAYAAQNPSKVFGVHIDNGGSGRARNIGICSARGEFLAFVDCDDYIEPDMMEQMYIAIKKNNADMAVCQYDRIDCRTNLPLSIEMTGFSDLCIPVLNNEIQLAFINTSPWNKLYRMSLVREITFPEMSLFEDLVYLSKIYPKLNRVCFVPRVLYHYIVSPNSAISRVSKEAMLRLFELFKQLEAIYKRESNSRMYELLEYMAVIHLGISLLFRMSFQKNIPSKLYSRQVASFLNKTFPHWRHNPYLSWRYGFSHGIRALAVSVAGMLHRMGLFGIFLFLYRLLLNITGAEFKW